ncbi:(2Fe-2S)-binding protein (plasmid) [Kozakia baliensis]|uniref:(2Fe-2S)-binding protein n=1 Tax=Kozakia baliensis TaxID=153496 RepID=UPI00345BEE03
MSHAFASIPCHFSINGKPYTVDLPPSVTLLDLLRERLDLTGTKKGCDHGQCGACTVLLDGKRVKSCLILAVSVSGSKITTIEGLERDGALHPMQQAFIDADAFQCGYCTPGQIMSAVALLEEGHLRSRDEIREFMSGNLCRCGAYNGIIDAIERVIAQRAQGEAASAKENGDRDAVAGEFA